MPFQISKYLAEQHSYSSSSKKIMKRTWDKSHALSHDELRVSIISSDSIVTEDHHQRDNWSRKIKSWMKILTYFRVNGTLRRRLVL